MIKALNTPSNSLHKIQSEDKYFYNQFKQTFEGFYKQPQTMKELSVRTGIGRANICRYCKTMRKQKAIAIVTKARCSITKHWANKYTTNPIMFPISSQLKLF